MATITSDVEIQDIRTQLKAYIDSSGETTTEIAIRADVPRDFLYRFLNDSYKSAPSFEYICRIMRAIGLRIVTKKL